MNKPYYHRKEGLENGTYIRLGRSTIHATAEMIEELKWQSRGKTFEALSVYHAKKSDLNEQALIQFFTQTRKKLQKTTLSENLLLSYPLLIKEHSTSYPNVAGVLLFSHNSQQFFSEAMIICSHFSGIAERKALATLDCSGTLFEQFDTAYDFILGRLNRSFVIKGKRRDEELEIPEEAIREVLLNAIVHRNYHINGPIKIAIYENRIEIFSPGSFPGPIDPHNLMLGVTYLRNPIICRAFREAGLVEKLGSGWLTLFSSYKKSGLEEPQIIEGVNFVKCILPRRTTRTKIILEEGDLQAIIKLFGTVSEISIVDVIQILKLPRATAGRRLAELQQKKRIKKIGSGKNTRYVLA
jgi:predicted HTH transcriptional regulator